MSAAIDVYVDANLVGNPRKLSNAFRDDGVVVKRAIQVWTKGTESDGTIYRAFKGLPGNLIPLGIWYAGAAIAGLTAVKCGLLLTGNVIPGGPINTGVVNAGSDACFATAADLHLGAINFKQAVALDLFTVVDAAFADPFKRLFEYAGDTVVNRKNSYDLALTCTTAGVNPGLMGVMLEYAMG